MLLLLALSCLPARAQHVSYRASRHYNMKVSDFERTGRLPDDAVVMLGDSHSEYGGDWNRFFPGMHRIVNRGIIGDDSRGILNRLCQILPARPRAIFFECGANDLSHGWSVERTFSGIVRVIETIRRLSPSTRLYVQSLLPLNEEAGVWRLLKGKEGMIISLNSRLRAYCDANALPFIDLYTPLLGNHPQRMRREYCRDGLHLTEKGYAVWADTIRPFMDGLPPAQELTHPAAAATSETGQAD